MNQWIRIAVALFIAFSACPLVQGAEWPFYGCAGMVPPVHSLPFLAAPLDPPVLLSPRDEDFRMETGSEIFGKGRRAHDTDPAVAWAEWHTGVGRFMVGKAQAPTHTRLFQSVYAFNSEAAFQSGEPVLVRSMVRFHLDGFQLAIVASGGMAAHDTQDPMEWLPRLEAAYTLKFHGGNVKIMGGYNPCRMDRNRGVDAYVVGLGGRVRMGNGFAAGSVFLGQNLGASSFDAPTAIDPGGAPGRSLENETLGLSIVSGYQFNDQFLLEAGWEYLSSEQEDPGRDHAAHFYLQSRFTLSPGIYVVPEIGRVDELTRNRGEATPETTYYGARCEINF